VEYADFCRLVQKDAGVTLAISGVTGAILTKHAHDVATVLQLNIFELELPYAFRNSSLPNEGHFASFAQNCAKLVATATSLKELEKEIQIDHLIRTNSYHLLKRL